MIALGCDHGGYELMQEVKAYLDKQGLEYQDFGCYSNEAVDYPVYARKVGHAIQNGTCDKGILICGTGIGISITANKMEGIRAALCTDCFCAEATRLHNDANVLAIVATVIITLRTWPCNQNRRNLPEHSIFRRRASRTPDSLD